MIRKILFNILIFIVNNKLLVVAQAISIPIASVRLRQLNSEGVTDEKLRKLAVLNMYHRNGGDVIERIIRLARAHLKAENINLRWIISSLDSISDSEHMSAEERALALAYSAHLNSLKFLFAHEASNKVQELEFGLTTFKAGGDLFANQRSRLVLLATNCKNEVLRDFFSELDARLYKVFLSKDIPYEV